MLTPDQISQIQQQLNTLHKTNEQNRQRRVVKEEQIRQHVASLTEKGILSCSADAPLPELLSAVSSAISHHQGILQAYAETASKVIAAVSANDYTAAEGILSSFGTPDAPPAPPKTTSNAPQTPSTPAPVSDVASAPVSPQNTPNEPISPTPAPSVVSLDTPAPQPAPQGFDINALLNQSGFQS